MARPFLLPLTLAAALAAGAALAQPAEDFLQKAIQGDTSEIMLGRLAIQHGATPAVRNFGQMLVHDHTQAQAEAQALAQRLSISAPTSPTNAAEAERLKLAGLSGRAFDREFVRWMIADHQHDIAEFQREAAQGGQVGELAQQSLPILQKHLKTAESLRGG